MINEDPVIKNPSDLSLSAEVVDMSNPPLVSICIPTFNDKDTIRNCLRSFSRQNYPNIEFVIVDGDSTDRTKEIVEGYTENIYIDEGTLGSARQTGLERAEGEIIGLFDGDIQLPHNEWLKNAVQYFSYSEQVSTVWPKNVAPPEGSPTSRLYFQLWEAIEEDRIASGRGPFGGGNALFRKSCLEEIGGINPDIHFGEDLVWAAELRKQGYQVVYFEDPIYHNTMRTFPEFVRKQFSYASLAKMDDGEVGLSTQALIYEQLIVGTRAMILGLVLKRKQVWLLYPIFLAVRAVAFGWLLIAEKFSNYGESTHTYSKDKHK